MPQMIVFVTNSFLTKAREVGNIECKKKKFPPKNFFLPSEISFFCIAFLILTNLKVVILDMTIGF